MSLSASREATSKGFRHLGPLSPPPRAQASSPFLGPNMPPEPTGMGYDKHLCVSLAVRD